MKTIYIMNTIIAALAFMFLYIFLTHKKDNKKEKINMKINSKLRKINKGYFSYERITTFLNETGNKFNLSPLGYLVGKCLISSIMFISFIISQEYIKSIIALILGFFALDIILYLNDKNDMKKISFELRNVYDLLNIQLSSGAFIGSALSESYLVVKNKRLKKALAMLSAEISMNKDIDKALDNFEKKFNSGYISNFVITIKQSLTTGKTIKSLKDMSDEISEMNYITIQQETKKVSSLTTLIQLLIFVGILVTVLYFTSSEITSNWTSLMNK